MDERSCSSLSRHGLASTYSFLDGVPFKIGQKFLQPQKIVVPPEISSPNHINVINKEYAFDTEEAVIAWAWAREQAVKQAAEEQAELAKDSEKTRSNNLSNTDQNSCSNELPSASDNVLPERKSADTNTTHDGLISQPVISASSKLSASKSLGAGEALLTPTPVQAQAAGHQASTSTSSDNTISLTKMFEQESDPFENLELQTLNDMEELKSLLVAPSNGIEKSLSNAHSDMLKDVNSLDSESSLSKGCTNTATSLENLHNVNGQVSKVSLSDCSSSSLNADQDEYVEISKESMNGSVILTNGDEKEDSVHKVQSCSKSSFKNKSPDPITDKLSKPILPPINRTLDAAEKSNEQLDCIQNSTHEQQSAVTSSEKVQGISSSVSATDLDSSKSVCVAPAKRKISMSSSVGPSLISFLNDDQCVNTDQAQTGHRNHLPSTQNDQDLAVSKNKSVFSMTSSVEQPHWNKYRPLPPTPDSYSPSQLPLKKDVGLGDPYQALSKDDQTFINNLTSMGFLRARVARAVEKFGQDSKEVLDHLLAVDKLVEKKYAPVNAETALHIFKNDTEKTEKFLTLLAQFEELGFKRDDIQAALITTSLDHDKTLDVLTS